ncbi:MULTISPECIES: PspA/IM30 family protein [Haloarcula]|uniref:Phage shock protein A n=1 Tax=Haloarcula pellucida TaxID=1427151 RepID=A0A830GM63_9EURY|nr:MULTISPECIES: PspA/IM30 family protein [Halomicroarcula]MBX0348892.1 PspA/IM30 family protein [Halomicroarcula pellucida]MDS0278656.1 PspA/IM30 family protein [Halomicroarcula sp. S1AR25-4]GGN91351.1 phage shock protein A [Halomicroarcula pellucida]
MSLLGRIGFAIRAKLNALLNRASDPSAELDYSYEELRDELQRVTRGIADVTTQKKRLEIHRRRLRENVEKYDGQAREAMRQERDDLARRALEKKQTHVEQITDLTDQIDSLQETQDRLVGKRAELSSQIEQFRTRKETMKARYEAAEASARVSEAFTGVGDTMADVNRSIERATERTERMEARAAALEELEESGQLESVLEEGDDIDRELDRISNERAVEYELETLREEMEADEQAAETAD